MSYANFHTHCMFCDGKGQPEEYVKKAISLGFISIGFSSHAPLPYKNGWAMRDGSQVTDYCTAIRGLKDKYADKIQIYLGLEVDCYPGIMSTDEPEIKALNLDYTIGSVHFIRNAETGVCLSIDGSEEEYAEIINGIYDGDAKKFVHDYYGLIKYMVQNHTPDIVGHLDLIKKNNKGGKYYDEEDRWYKREVIETLETVAQSGAILEINTGGISRGYMDTFYPPIWSLAESKSLGIPIILNSDAHSPEHLNTYFKEAAAALIAAGYTSELILLDGIWKELSLA